MTNTFEAVAPAADVLIVGSGVAGLAAALGLEGVSVRVLTKGTFGASGSSPWAQGGIAAALGGKDSPEIHADDTVAVGGGVSDGAAVTVLSREGPGRIVDLLELGTRFDRGENGDLLLGREAAHSRRRVLHAGGDATGAEMVRALSLAAKEARWIEIRERVFVEDLLVEDGTVLGVVARHAGEGTILHRAGAVILAAGGIGQLYRWTTNPPECTGDGLAMAARAGAVLADLEFVQFHPTALACEKDPLPLLTEAIRGDGAILVDETGDRFVEEVDDRAELAPRDVVARALWARRREGREVFLDARKSTGERFLSRFPTVFARCREQGIDPRTEPIPVTPAAHYHMGGVAVDLNGRTSLPGLWACGEVASTGAHGANRLASNSLLEGLVFGRRAAEDVAGAGLPRPTARRVQAAFRVRPPRSATGEPAGRRKALRNLLWENVGLVREERGLMAAAGTLRRWAAEGHGVELGNLIEVAELVTAAAATRRESRGAHHRSDFPEADPAWRRRSFYSRDELLTGALGEAEWREMAR